MNSTAFRRFGAIAGTAAFITAITVTGSTAPAIAGQRDTAKDRPCFMIRSTWNNAEGPQPTCPTPMWQTASSLDKADEAGASRPLPSARITDFMP